MGSKDKCTCSQKTNLFTATKSKDITPSEESLWAVNCWRLRACSWEAAICTCSIFAVFLRHQLQPPPEKPTGKVHCSQSTYKLRSRFALPGHSCLPTENKQKTLICANHVNAVKAHCPVNSDYKVQRTSVAGPHHAAVCMVPANLFQILVGLAFLCTSSLTGVQKRFPKDFLCRRTSVAKMSPSKWF